MSAPTVSSQLADIPRDRVRQAVKALLDLDDLDDVIEVRIGIEIVQAVVYARDAAGHVFVDGGTRHLARHTLEPPGHNRWLGPLLLRFRRSRRYRNRTMRPSEVSRSCCASHRPK